MIKLGCSALLELGSVRCIGPVKAQHGHFLDWASKASSKASRPPNAVQWTCVTGVCSTTGRTWYCGACAFLPAQQVTRPPNIVPCPADAGRPLPHLTFSVPWVDVTCLTCPRVVHLSWGCVVTLYHVVRLPAMSACWGAPGPCTWVAPGSRNNWDQLKGQGL